MSSPPQIPGLGSSDNRVECALIPFLCPAPHHLAGQGGETTETQASVHRQRGCTLPRTTQPRQARRAHGVTASYGALGVPRLLTAWPPGRGWTPPPAAPRAVTCPASPCRPQSPPGQGNGCRRAPCRLFQKHGTRPPAGSTWEEPHISPILRLNVSVKPRLRTCPLATAVARPGGHTAQAGGWDDAPLAAVGSGAKDAAGLRSRHKWALA